MTNINTEQDTPGKILEKDLCYKIQGCVYNVMNKYGRGLKESIYQNALAEEFLAAGLKADGQKRINIYSFVWGLSTEVSYNTLGYYLCLDSAYFPPDGEWLWTTPNGGFTPSWDGPHCYLIQNNDDDINENVPGIYVTDIEGSWNNGTKVTTGPSCHMDN